MERKEVEERRRELAKQVGQRIYSIRTEMGITQAELARRTEVSKISISRYERGENMPPIDNAVRIAEELYTTVEYLVNGEG